MIPYFIPFLGKKERRAVEKAVWEKSINGDGKICKAAEKKLCEMLDTHSVFLTTSGTHAIELALMALGIKNGDEVICPSFTFVSTANAIIRQGARPVFAEIEKSTLNIDIEDAARRITNRTRAIIPVHYAGLSCDMGRLVKIAAKRNIYVVEDAAQAIGAKYDGKPLGSFGEVGCISFHSTKNITCGEGGALAVNKRKLERNIQIMREKGTNRSLFLEGKIKKYSWIDVGSSFVISDLLAALLLAQLDKLSFINRKRRAIFEMYKNRLKSLEEKGLISLPHPDKKSYGNGHIFWILLKKGISRNLFIQKLKKRGVECTHHYIPLHSSPFGIRNLGYRRNDFPVTEEISKRLVRLPMHNHLTSKDVSYIIENVAKLLYGGTKNARKN